MGNRKRLVVLIILVITLVVTGVGYWLYQRDSNESYNNPNSTINSGNEKGNPTSENNKVSEYTSPKGVVIRVTSPSSNSIIASPLTVYGEVPGNWSFEADFPIDILNSNRQVIVSGYATLAGNWMTESYVSFSSSITFPPQSSGSSGFLILSKSNASGLPEHEDSIELPIRF